MSRAILAAFLSMVASIHAINRPVYKVVLTQKGYAQFLQYDVETPPLREFTFCTWIRLFDLDSDQSIFTYVANGNNRVVRLWLDSGGRHLKISIKGKVTSSMSVDVVKDVWRHVCMSYQSDFGAWAVYVDSRLVSCEAAQSLVGFVLPSGGSVIIGYGTANTGAPNGFEGEIFGANMILTSTIERNYTMKADPLYEQKIFSKNKLKKESKELNYVILSDLFTDEIHNNYEKSIAPLKNSTKSYIKFHTPYNFVEHEVGVDASSKKPNLRDASIEEDVFDFTISEFKTINKDKIDFWNSNDNPRVSGRNQSQVTRPIDVQSKSNTQIPMVSEYETPPPPPPPLESIYSLKGSTLKSNKIYNAAVTELSDIETPPPENSDTKVYGQWSTSKFPGTVLNYLKSINFNNREQFTRKVPQTIPLYKVSDSHPYSSEFKVNMLRLLSQFRRKNLVEKRYDIIKRDPQYNVQILEDDLRNNILKIHADTQPKKVEITNRGEPNIKREHRHYRHALYKQNSDELNLMKELYYHSTPKPFQLNEYKEYNHKYFTQPPPSKTSVSTLPYLKSLEYLDEDSHNTESSTVSNSKGMYLKSISSGNKWHNVKTYNNDYTPRKINMDSDEAKVDNNKKQYPAVRLKYVHEKRKLLEEASPTLLNGRKLAMEVSNQSTKGLGSVSILKYNHGYLPDHDEKIKEDKQNPIRKRVPFKRNMDPTSFDKQIKIGNALNERDVIGDNDEEKRQSFIGGNEKIPDINKYRSDIDSESQKVPPSLGPRVCKNVELYDRVLYVQQDESIDMTHILSPVREKNIGIEFVMLNYKKCSLTDSSFQKDAKLLIDWSKTPVRLFGGAFPKTTTDLCGFF